MSSNSEVKKIYQLQIDKKIIAITAAVFVSLLMLSSSSLASVSSVTTSASTSRATTGTSVTVSVTVTATTSETASVQLISSPSGITITDPASGQYQGVSVSTSPTTKTFTLTASSANTYSYYGQAGGTTSTAQTIVFVDPSTFTVSGSPSSKSASSGDTFTYTVTVTNPGSDTTTSSYSLTKPSGWSDPTGDATSGTITIGGDSSTMLIWTITVGSSSGTVAFNLGDKSSAATVSVTVSAAGVTTTTTAAAGSTGSSVATAVKLTKKYTSVIPEVAKAITSVDLDQTDTALTEILISVASRVTDAEISIERQTSLPENIPSPAATTYRIIKIDQKNLEENNLAAAKLKFKVEKSWMTANSIDEKTIALHRLSGGKWNKLETAKIDQDAKYVYFEATTPGFSYFVIGGEKLKAEEPTPTPEEKPAAPEEKPAAPVEGKPDYTTYYVVGGIIAVIVVVILALFKRGIIKLPQ